MGAAKVDPQNPKRGKAIIRINSFKTMEGPVIECEFL